MINGRRGNFFYHGRGLRKRGPLSPLLFILAIDPIQKMFEIATQEGFFTPIAHRNCRFRLSLYADAAAIFINPLRNEVQVIQQLLAVFSEVPGLAVNQRKCSVFPICCDHLPLC